MRPHTNILLFWGIDMQLKDIMTTNVITASPDMSYNQVRELIREHRLRRIPVLDKKGKLVGLVSKEKLLSVRPSPATSLSVWEITTLLDELKVKDFMYKDVVTASPEMTVEAAIQLARGKRVGALPILDGDKLVGIVTTNDYVVKILNPLLGIGEPGSRITIHDAHGSDDKKTVHEIIGKAEAKVVASLYVDHPGTNEKDLIIHLDQEDVSDIVKELEEKGYKVEIRQRNPN